VVCWGTAHIRQSPEGIASAKDTQERKALEAKNRKCSEDILSLEVYIAEQSRVRSILLTKLCGPLESFNQLQCHAIDITPPIYPLPCQQLRSDLSYYHAEKSQLEALRTSNGTSLSALSDREAVNQQRLDKFVLDKQTAMQRSLRATCQEIRGACEGLIRACKAGVGMTRASASTQAGAGAGSGASAGVSERETGAKSEAQLFAPGGATDGDDIVLEEDIASARTFVERCLRLTEFGFAVPRAELSSSCDALNGSAGRLLQIVSHLEPSSGFRNAAEWLASLLAVFVTSVYRNVGVWQSVTAQFARSLPMLDGALEHGRLIKRELETHVAAMLSAAKACRSTVPDSVRPIEVAATALLALSTKLRSQEIALSSWKQVSVQLAHASTFVLHVAWLGVQLALANTLRSDALAELHAALSVSLKGDPVTGIVGEESMLDALAQLKLQYHGFGEACVRPLLPFGLECVTSPGSVILSASAMIAATGKAGIGAAYMLKHCWQGLAEYCSNLLSPTHFNEDAVTNQFVAFLSEFRKLVAIPSEYVEDTTYDNQLCAILIAADTSVLQGTWLRLRRLVALRIPEHASTVEPPTRAAQHSVLSISVGAVANGN
jgi:hypothetical protein